MVHDRKTTMDRQRFQVGPSNGDAVPPPIPDTRRGNDEKTYQIRRWNSGSIPSPVPEERTPLPEPRHTGDEKRQQPGSRHAGSASSLASEYRRIGDERRDRLGSRHGKSIPLPVMEHERREDERRRYETQKGSQNAVVIPSQHLRIDDERPYRLGSRDGDMMPPPVADGRGMDRDTRYQTRLQDSDLLPSAVVDNRLSNKEKTMDAVSVSKSSMVSDMVGQFPQFFSSEIFQLALHHPTTAHQLLKFSQVRFCGENMEFLEKVDRYNSLLAEMTKTLTDIHGTFISHTALRQVNLSEPVMKAVHLGVQTSVRSTLPALESIFVEAQQKIEHLVYTDIYPRFVRYQMTMSATKALANDRSRYQGLGDCFCLTSPSKADNPILYASDGFVKVTGYSRAEIIPRNCRFLQGQQTDRMTVQRLKAYIDAREESVELLLNYKKNGEPFWNLLYVGKSSALYALSGPGQLTCEIAPLFDADGNVAFFIGGQINCSTTINNRSDVLRILSISDDVEEEKPSEPLSPKSTSSFGKKGLLKAFRAYGGSTAKNQSVGREAGMEQGLLNRIEKMDIKTQMSEFYTAYSKYVVVRYDNFLISFYSSGIADMLNPSNLLNSRIVGTDVFRFLKQNATSNVNECRAKVRAALREGHATSVEVFLETRRSMVFRGDEKFTTHWTPLKDENAVVNYIVVTLSPMLQ